MENFFISLGTYVLIDLISLAILVAYKDTFIRAARLGFQRLGIQPVVNNYNTYRSSNNESSNEDEDEEEIDLSSIDEDDEELNDSEEDADEEDEEESTSELLERMGGENIIYGSEVNDEDDNKPQ